MSWGSMLLGGEKSSFCVSHTLVNLINATTATEARK